MRADRRAGVVSVRAAAPRVARYLLHLLRDRFDLTRLTVQHRGIVRGALVGALYGRADAGVMGIGSTGSLQND
jgi:hypothetical protein